jgi:3-hydroxypropanoate dehydrogenase
MSAADGAVARKVISSDALDQLFREARTYRKWRPGRLPETVLKDLYELAALGPTSGNCLPARFVFIASGTAKERLVPALDPGNVEKTRTAPVTVIVAYDSDFVETIRRFTNNPNAMPWLASNPAAARETAFRNGSLQGGYLILAARALGLELRPHVGLQRGNGESRILSRRQVEGELPLQHGLRGWVSRTPAAYCSKHNER